jgi:hypothetical protein
MDENLLTRNAVEYDVIDGVGVAGVLGEGEWPSRIRKHKVCVGIPAPGVGAAATAPNPIRNPRTGGAIVDIEPEVIIRLIELAIEVAHQNEGPVGTGLFIDPLFQNSPLTQEHPTGIAVNRTL